MYIYRKPLLASSVPSPAPSTSIYKQLPVDYQQLPVYYEPSSLHEHFESLPSSSSTGSYERPLPLLPLIHHLAELTIHHGESGLAQC